MLTVHIPSLLHFVNTTRRIRNLAQIRRQQQTTTCKQILGWMTLSIKQ